MVDAVNAASNEKAEKTMERFASLQKVLSSDFQSVHGVLERGLEVPVELKASIYCTSTVEAICGHLLQQCIGLLHEDASANYQQLNTKIAPKYLQLALRMDSDLKKLLTSVETMPEMLTHFLNRATAQLLCDKGLMEVEEMKAKFNDENEKGEGGEDEENADGMEDDEEDEMKQEHDKTQTEWQRRKDDPFSDADFANILKCVDPAFTLTHDGSVLLSAFVREVLNAICEELEVQDNLLSLNCIELAVNKVFRGKVGESIGKLGKRCLEAFDLPIPDTSSFVLKFHHVLNVNKGTKAIKQVSVRATTKNQAIFEHMSRKLHFELADVVFVYRGQTLSVDAQPTPLLTTATGSAIFIVSKKWWNHRRRDDARRGMLTSVRSNENAVKQFKAQAVSRVNCQPTASPPKASARRKVGKNIDEALQSSRENETSPQSSPRSRPKVQSPTRATSCSPNRSPKKTTESPSKQSPIKKAASPFKNPGYPKAPTSPSKKTAISPLKKSAASAAAAAAKSQFLEQLRVRTEESLQVLDSTSNAYRAAYNQVLELQTDLDGYEKDSSEVAFNDVNRVLRQHVARLEEGYKSSKQGLGILLRFLSQWDKIDRIQSPSKGAKESSSSSNQSVEKTLQKSSVAASGNYEIVIEAPVSDEAADKTMSKKVEQKATEVDGKQSDVLIVEIESSVVADTPKGPNTAVSVGVVLPEVKVAAQQEPIVAVVEDSEVS